MNNFKVKISETDLWKAIAINGYVLVTDGETGETIFWLKVYDKNPREKENDESTTRT